MIHNQELEETITIFVPFVKILCGVGLPTLEPHLLVWDYGTICYIKLASRKTKS